LTDCCFVFVTLSCRSRSWADLTSRPYKTDFFVCTRKSPETISPAKYRSASIKKRQRCEYKRRVEIALARGRFRCEESYLFFSPRRQIFINVYSSDRNDLRGQRGQEPLLGVSHRAYSYTNVRSPGRRKTSCFFR